MDILIDNIRRELIINKKLIPLTSIEYCYYYFFIRRAKNGQPFIPISGIYAPDELSVSIKELHEQIFPDVKHYRKEIEKIILNGKLLNLTTTVRAHISKINKKIHQKEYRIVKTGQRGLRAYGIAAEPDTITISTPLVIPTFSKQIHVFSESDTLADVLVFMNQNHYSQVVMKKGLRLHLITPESILEMLQNLVIKRRRMIDLSDIFLSLITFDNDSSVAFYRPERTVDEARKEFFTRFSENAPRLSAIIITKNGLGTAEPLGIITPWDFIDKKHW
jgi:hypothetical protein